MANKKSNFKFSRKTKQYLIKILSLVIVAFLTTVATKVVERIEQGQGTSGGTSAVSEPISYGEFDYSQIPAFTGEEPFVTVNGNVPYFSDEEYTSVSYLELSPLDSLGRAGVANAVLGPETLQQDKRSDISSIHPSGWWEAKRSTINVNRCHLIGNQLAGNDTDVAENMVTGTRYMNVIGMLPYENLTDDYIEDTGNHVRYRVTPIFAETYDVTCVGVLMEAASVEDHGESLSFNVFCYNADAEYEVDYTTGEWSLIPQD